MVQSSGTLQRQWRNVSLAVMSRGDVWRVPPDGVQRPETSEGLLPDVLRGWPRRQGFGHIDLSSLLFSTAGGLLSRRRGRQKRTGWREDDKQRED